MFNKFKTQEIKDRVAKVAEESRAELGRKFPATCDQNFIESMVNVAKAGSYLGYLDATIAQHNCLVDEYAKLEQKYIEAQETINQLYNERRSNEA